MKKIIFAFACLTLTQIGLSFAQDKLSGLTFQQCIGQARSRNEELRAQTDRITEARERKSQAKGNFFPSIGLNYAKLFQDSVNGTFDGETTNSALSLTQPIFYGSRITDGLALSNADIAREQANYKTLLRALDQEVTGSFYAIVQFQTDIKNLEDSVNTMLSRYQELKERARLGKSRESELLAVESQVATLRGQMAQVEAGKIKAAEGLARLLGIESADIVLIDDTPGPENIAELETYIKAVISRSDIEAARQSSVIQSKRIGIAKSFMIPSVSLDGNWYLARSGSMSEGKWDASILANMPLFQGGILRARVNEETARKKELDEDLSITIRDAVSEVKQLYQAVVLSINQSQAYKDAYDKAEKSYQLQLKDYRFGLVNNLDVIQATLTMLDAKRNLDRTTILVKSNKALLEISVKE
jgi:outer membrane protein TolC